MEKAEIEKLAMLYTELNSKPGDFVEQLYDRYSSAIETLRKIESEAVENRIAKSGISL